MSKFSISKRFYRCTSQYGQAKLVLKNNKYYIESFRRDVIDQLLCLPQVSLAHQRIKYAVEDKHSGAHPASNSIKNISKDDSTDEFKFSINLNDTKNSENKDTIIKIRPDHGIIEFDDEMEESNKFHNKLKQDLIDQIDNDPEDENERTKGIFCA